MASPPFRADHVGSLLRPPELLHARDEFAHERITGAALQAAEDRAVADVVRLQEDLGFQAASDGEFRRTQWNVDFLSAFDNTQVGPGRVPVAFHTEHGDLERKPLGVTVTGTIARSRPIFVEHFRYLRSIARAVPKITIPSPTSMHFRGGREAVDRGAYPEMQGFYDDLVRAYREEIGELAAAGCRYLQIDEVNLAYMCDATVREPALRNLGMSATELLELYAGLINGAIRDRPADMTICLHLCRGNFKGAWVAEGGFDPVAEVLFNEIDATGYFLEFDTVRAGGFEPLRYVPKGKTVVLGLVSTKTPVLESQRELERRIEDAARFLPLDQLALSPQCGFASAVLGSPLTIEDEIAKLRLVVDTAQTIWG